MPQRGTLGSLVELESLPALNTARSVLGAAPHDPGFNWMM